jgi:HTH-type transcriptional regulator/antitoxin HipB
MTKDSIAKPSQSATELALQAARSISARSSAAMANAVSEGLNALTSLGRNLTPIRNANHFGELVRLARQKQGLSQQHLADAAGVGRRFLSELESGKSTLEFGKVLQVAAAAGIDLLARSR